jgi:hypothetical protein
MLLSAGSDDDLQRSVPIAYQLQLIAEKISMKISFDKTKLMTFKGKEHIRSKICVYDKP